MSGGGFMTSALTAALEERDQLRAEVERLRAENEKAARFMAAFGAKP